MRFTRRLLALAAAGLALTMLAGCGPALIRVEVPTTNVSRDVDMQGAKDLDVELRMAIGEMSVRGGATGAMGARFDCAPSDLVPNVSYSVESSTGILRVEQPESRPHFGDVRSRWDVRLADGVPMHLRVKTGVGKSTLDLWDLSLESLEVVGGVGDTSIDLGSIARRDVTVDVEGGVGKIVLRVPREAGVRVWGYQDGVGRFEADGFTPDDGANVMTNENYDKPGVKRYDVRVQRGVGDVIIEQR